MKDERFRSQENSRLSNYSGRHYDFLDTHHSVFSRTSYYHDMHSVHPWTRRPRSRNSGIPLTALRTASCSARLDDLARPKIKRERMIRQEFFDNIHNYAYSGVKTTALTAQCSEHLAALARPKTRAHDYKEVHKLPRSPSEQALRTSLSDRMHDLAKPRHNTMLINAAWKNNN